MGIIRQIKKVFHIIFTAEFTAFVPGDRFKTGFAVVLDVSPSFDVKTMTTRS